MIILEDGAIYEGLSSNICFIRGNTILSPPFPLILPGTILQNIARLAKTIGIDFVERGVALSEIREFDHCFICSTSRLLIPVLEVYLGDVRFCSFKHSKAVHGIQELLKKELKERSTPVFTQ